ncbi:MAG: hypothetical protein M1827_005180 [Pycnora praestabilis]|nr:MAG: hypothetical protein M1827_005180 [Pycnora praestabilis]
MRFLMLGANGRTGKHALSEAIRRGHTVTALVRRPESIEAQPGLTIVTGTPYSSKDLSSAFATVPTTDPVRAVVSSLGGGGTPIKPAARQMAEAISNMLGAMRDNQVNKIVLLSTAGIGSSTANFGAFGRFIVKYSYLKGSFEDHEKIDQMLKSTGGIRYVAVRAVGLDNSANKPIKEHGDDGKGMGSFISRQSVGKFMIDAAEKNTWDQHTPVISN